MRKLTPREIQIAEMVSQGMRDARIAALLGSSTGSVKKILQSVYAKLGYSNRVRLAIAWRCPIFQLGLEALGFRKAVSK